ncbi:uncharacterized protein LOC101861807 [Aplysia californica]|uniref:Uncharacterized protein LOC101861807 n=1 Tax=Aplysia californica TaxID=6500 RepID=A0ABM0ZY84_APLCA|nr:uncharacterized protein LOC101861807 [Aplysia californica]
MASFHPKLMTMRLILVCFLVGLCLCDKAKTTVIKDVGADNSGPYVNIGVERSGRTDSGLDYSVRGGAELRFDNSPTQGFFEADISKSAQRHETVANMAVHGNQDHQVYSGSVGRQFHLDKDTTFTVSGNVRGSSDSKPDAGFNVEFKHVW